MKIIDCIKSIVPLIFCCTVLTGCKYEDGPFISFISAHYRITGNYTIDKFQINGIDTTNYYKSQNCYTDISFLITEEVYRIANYGITNCNPYMNGSWSLRENNNILRLYRVVSVPVLGPWGQFDSFDWNIIRLSDDGFIIEGKSFNDTYRIEFKKL